MSGEMLGDRRRALEESYFDQKDKELLEQMRRKMETGEREKALAEATGITDKMVLADLAKSGSEPGALAALGLVPLVEIAWSDGSISDGERTAVLKAAAEMGIAAGSPSQELLQKWLIARPPVGAVVAWKEYVKALVGTMPPDRAKSMQASIIGRAKKVAESSGGILGMGNKISAAEQGMLDDLAKAFEK